MKFIVTLFLSNLFFFNSFSQTGKVEGKVMDSKTGTSLSSVSVTAAGSEKGGASDMDGKFILTLSPGTYTIKLSSVGYQVKEVSDVTVTAGTITNLDIVLETAAKTETEVVVRSSRRQESVASLISYQKNTNTVGYIDGKNYMNLNERELNV